MSNFFCLSKYEEDVILAAHAVSVLSKKTNTSNILYTPKKYFWQELYPNVSFSDDLPIFLIKLSRRPIHQDVVEDDDGEPYINAWVGQQRHSLIGSASGDKIEAAIEIARNCIGFFGIRGRVTREDFLLRNNFELPEIAKPFSATGVFVTILNDMLEDLDSVKSASSAIGYYAPVSEAKSSDNLIELQSSLELLAAIIESDVVVCKSEVMLLPFASACFDKKILLLNDKKPSFFNNIECLSSTPQLIKSLIAKTQGEA